MADGLLRKNKMIDCMKVSIENDDCVNAMEMECQCHGNGVGEPHHLVEDGASRYTALAVPAPLESGDFPSTAGSGFSSSRSSHRKKTDIGGQGACGPCG